MFFQRVLMTLLILSSLSFADNTGFFNNPISLTVNSPTIKDVIAGPYNTVVNNDIEFGPHGYGDGYYVVNVDIDLTNNSIYFDYSDADQGTFSTKEFNGYIFTDIDDRIPDIINVTIDEQETTLGINENRIFFNKNQIYINVSSLHVDPTSRLKLNIEFNTINDSSTCFPVKATNDNVSIICF